jgi:hypothetical protein
MFFFISMKLFLLPIRYYNITIKNKNMNPVITIATFLSIVWILSIIFPVLKNSIDKNYKFKRGLYNLTLLDLPMVWVFGYLLVIYTLEFLKLF